MNKQIGNHLGYLALTDFVQEIDSINNINYYGSKYMRLQLKKEVIKNKLSYKN